MAGENGWRADQHHVYVYHAGGRDDGMDFAVGEYHPDRPVNGSLALFMTAADCETFVLAWRQRTGGAILVLPGAAAAGMADVTQEAVPRRTDPSVRRVTACDTSRDCRVDASRYRGYR